jgi:integrase
MSRKWTPKYLSDVRSLLRKYAYPKLEQIPISAIDHLLISEVMMQPASNRQNRPLWEAMPPTGGVILGHVTAILDRAKNKGYRTGDNPASMHKGAPLSTLLHPISEIRVVKHRASLPYQEVPAFMAKTRARGIHNTHKMATTIITELLQFVILTGVRSTEAREMRWDEISWKDRLWVCPKRRTKTKKTDHLVPLSEPALAILKKMKDLQNESGVAIDFVFVRNLPHASKRSSHQSAEVRQRRHLRQIQLAKPFGVEAIVRFLQDTLGRKDLTVHGFRSSFSTWANDLGRSREAIEMTLDHKVGNDIELTYNQAQRLQQRRMLLEEWGEYCSRAEPLPADVVPFRQTK